MIAGFFMSIIGDAILVIAALIPVSKVDSALGVIGAAVAFGGLGLYVGTGARDP